MISRILIATDGRPVAMGALRVGRLLAEREGAEVEVISVLEAAALYEAASSETTTTPPGYVGEGLRLLRERVDAQLAEIGGGAPGWPVAVETGRSTPTIARMAAERGADIILLGLSEHRGVEGWVRRETLLRLVNLSHLPVWAVPSMADHLPDGAVVGVDFSDFSLRAARAATALLPRGGRVDLVHSEWAPDPGERPQESTEWFRARRGECEVELEAMARKLEDESGVSVRAHLRVGDPGEEILAVADTVGADLVAVGSHGHGFIGRLILGSVSGRVAHQIRRHLLVMPPTAPATWSEPRAMPGGEALTEGRTR
jgi:nucleotide-binding universal stress UspA family protein